MTYQLTPLIMMNGNAKEAIQFYEESLDARILFMQTIGEGPETPESPIPANVKDLVAHSLLKVGDMEIMVSDIIPGQPHQRGNQVTICITTNEKEEAKQIYEALSQSGQVNSPLQETYFSPAYGMVTDKFGVCFHIFTNRQH
ncbi:VOC family protein [Paenibacillus baekrokdamisoli]|uniref:VOC family protein n=1 Tax=Paenibacillus baekrokdamisoli TaxID=1712516 RepID=A0A3G9J8A1_9BACL|nr:VOC family protein [Paenibacillus baekrokdamisoli]MBB3071390.1 PhnB protein [Paenibacillus baekrokdamisoli]BBH24575.1 VOC family protein [Paenibacillus baekrokdamisoli]